MALVCLSVIYYTKLMLASDKMVINSMINYDMNVAELNLTASEALTQLAPDITINEKTLLGKFNF
jgi:hypothetical protein